MLRAVHPDHHGPAAGGGQQVAPVRGDGLTVDRAATMIWWARTGASPASARSTSMERPTPVDTNDQRPLPVTVTANGIPVSVTNCG